MTATQTLPPLETPILIDGMTWREFKAVEQLLDRPGVRLSFLDGLLEIRKVPGEQHETLKERIGTLLDLYLLQLGIDYTPTGSMTLESVAGAVKREADKSYKLGPDRIRPDLVIEVVVTSGGINKLEAYKRLQISEVWFWEKGRLTIYVLKDNNYLEASQSDQLPELDIPFLTYCINLPNHIQAVKEFQQSFLR